MPSIHIPEDTWADLLMQYDGDHNRAREAVKDAARQAAQDGGENDG